MRSREPADHAARNRQRPPASRPARPKGLRLVAKRRSLRQRCEQRGRIVESGARRIRYGQVDDRKSCRAAPLERHREPIAARPLAAGVMKTSAASARASAKLLAAGARHRGVLEHLRRQVLRVEILTSLIAPSAPFTASSRGCTNPRVRRQVQLVHTRHDLVAQRGIEMHAVGFEQLLRGRVVPFGLDALHFREQPATPSGTPSRPPSRNTSCRRASAARSPRVFAISQCTIIWRLRMWSSSICVPSRTRRSCTSAVLAYASYSACTTSSCSSGSDEAQLHELVVRQKIQRHQVRARLFERGVLLLQHRLRAAVQPVGHLPGRVADHLVEIGGELADERAATSRARAASSGVHENSVRKPGSIAPSYASLMFESETDLLPYFSRTS